MEKVCAASENPMTMCKEIVFPNIGRKTGQDSSLCLTESRKGSLGLVCIMHVHRHY